MSLRPYEKLLPDTPNVIKCRDFLLQNVKQLGGCRGTGIFIFANDVQSACIEYACHATLNPKYSHSGIVQAAGGVNPTKDEFATTMKFLEWLFNASPWECLFKDGFEIVWGKDDLPKGVILSEECCKKFPGEFLKNLFILLRCIQEFHGSFKAWETLVSNGMHPDDAFFICRYVTLADEDQFASSDLTLNGWHWPLTFGDRYNYSETFDFDAYYSHKPNLVNNPIRGQTYNKFFMKKHRNYEEFNVKGVTLSKRGRFSSVGVLNSKALIEGFDKWKDQNGFPKPGKTGYRFDEENLDY